jgi:phosphopantothenoylcysteine decarboxylase/phosphopantothenate--cysteine ligase
MKKTLRFLVVSGPTREPLDPVRYLSNYSTGVMGAELAAAVHRRGHKLTWVRCPEMAESARNLLELLKKKILKHDVLVMAAAVCDVRPRAVASGKIKKTGLSEMRFVPNPDVLATLGKLKRRGQVFVGFALESKDILRNAKNKLKTKNLEMILVQKVGSKARPFGKTSVNAVLLDNHGERTDLPAASKAKIAALIVLEAEKRALSQE